jgi:N-methylhydantoinase B/oxoprolinase/acetone carboxylase alpha subunit
VGVGGGGVKDECHLRRPAYSSMHERTSCDVAVVAKAGLLGGNSAPPLCLLNMRTFNLISHNEEIIITRVELSDSHLLYDPTSGPFGDSMSAAARPKRWDVSRQAKGRDFVHPTKIGSFTLLT